MKAFSPTRWHFLRAVVFSIGLTASSAEAERTVDFSPVAAIQQSTLGPAILGGRLANTQDYPASFYATDGKEACSATLVAERAVLTAAHCVEGAVVRMNTSSGQRSGTCRHASSWPADQSADWALCLLDTAAPGPFENVNINAGLLFPQREIRLTGFGCTKPDGAGRDGKFREGETTIIDLPIAGDSNLIITRGGAAICPGDSGGAAFIALDAGAYQRRLLIAVNSRAAIDPVTGNVIGTSYLSSLSTVEARTFLREWSQIEGVPLCGISAGAVNCRVR